MNELTKFLIDSILKEEEGVTALFGGGFKPPTKGHLEVVLKGIKENPEINNIIIYVGSGVRNNISQEEAIKVWEMYQKLIPIPSQIVGVGSPFNAYKQYLTDHPDQTTYVLIGGRVGNEDDDKDIAERSKFIGKYNGVPKVVSTPNAGISGTAARTAAKISKEKFLKFIPDELEDNEKDLIYSYIQSVVKEQVDFKSLESQLDDMFAELDIDVAFTNHFKERVIERGLTEEDIIELANKIIDQYPDELDFIDKGQNIVMSHLSRLVDIAAVNTGYGDDYLKDLVFKTAYKRKDKSEPEFRTNASSPRLAVNENASYSKEINIREKIDQLTQHMIDKGMNIEPLPSLEFVNGDTKNARDFFGKTAYYEPDTQTIVLYTEGRHPKDIVRSYAHEMIHHIQNLEGRLGNITTTNTQEDDHLNDLEAEANLKGTMTFRNWTDSLEEKKVKDPFGLNQFARELMTEGAYDALTTKLTKATINKWVEDSKQKPMPKKSFVDIDIDEFDGKGREIEFNYVGIVEFDKKIDGYEVDGTSNSGEDKGKMPFVATMFRINPKILPQAWSKISADVSDVIRHEIEHLTQAGDNTRSGKYMQDDIDIRDLINKAKVLPQKNYYMLEKEVDAMLQGLYLKAKKTKKPFKDVLKNYLSMAPGIETKEDKEIILNLWRSRRKALSLPVFENEEKVMDYKIFLDMDGVLVNFDQQFQELTGMMPREFESKYSSDKFWEEIDGAGVGFWRGMKWMPGGEALYNRASQYDHALLSSPSRSEVSKIGKRLWRRDKTPDTKLILARSYNKRKYAAPNHILIDDREDNIQQWRDAGGIGILYKSAEQVNAELDKLGL